MKKPVIMTDCDGVLLQWLAHTPKFVEDLGFDSSHLREAMSGNQFIPFFDVFCAKNEKEALERLHQYHESDYMKYLPVIEDGSQKVLERLSEHFNIVVLTSFSDQKIAHKNRLENLELHYGDSIYDLICLKPEEDKTPVLKDYAKENDVVLWVDDQIKHVHHGLAAGIDSYQYTYKMNCGRNTGEVKEIDSWLSIEKMIMENKLENIQEIKNRNKLKT